MKLPFRAQGFALPAVIFMMVVVTLLITYMARIQNTQSATGDLRLQGTRAYWAAKAGVEWAAYQVNRNNNCAAATGTLVLNGFQVAVACASRSYTEAGNTVSLYQVSVLAQSAGSVSDPDYVSRQITLVLNVES